MVIICTVVFTVLIWYTGHGEKGTGNWVLEDGCLRFADIYSLYMKYFKGRYLYIVTDCCYSGSWVKDCARLLDRNDIMCGHDAKFHQVFIKVFASCLPNEQAWDKVYTECEGVKLHSDGSKKSIVFAEHRRLEFKPGSYCQTTLGMDFTRTDQCISDGNGKCIHRRIWTLLVHRLIEENCSENYLI